MEGNRSVWIILAILLIPMAIVLAGWLSFRVDTTETKITALLIVTVFFLVGLGLLIEVLLADLVYWIVAWGLGALSDALLAPFGERVYRIALAAKWVLILVCVVVGIIDLVAKLARIAERLIPCEAVYRELFNAPCDAKLLARCPFTAPLANLVLRDMGDLSVRAGSLLDVTLEYLGLCTDLTYLLLVAVLLSGLPRRLWQQIAFSLSSLIGQGKAQTALNRSANEFVHKYGKHWIVAVRDGKTYHAPCIRRQHRYLPRETFTTGSLEEVVRETYVFASRDEALIQVRRLLKGVNNYLVTQYKRRR